MTCLPSTLTSCVITLRKLPRICLGGKSCMITLSNSLTICLGGNYMHLARFPCCLAAVVTPGQPMLTAIVSHTLLAKASLPSVCNTYSFGLLLLCAVYGPKMCGGLFAHLTSCSHNDMPDLIVTDNLTQVRCCRNYQLLHRLQEDFPWHAAWW